MPITKCNYLVRSVDELADTVREAFAIARSGRPGPVLLDIPKNVTAEFAEYAPLPRSQHGTSGRLGKLMERSSQNFRAPEPDHRDIDRLVEMINESQKPLLICGGGVVRSRAQMCIRDRDIPGNGRRTQQRQRKGLSGEAGQGSTVCNPNGLDGQWGRVHQCVACDEVKARSLIHI